MARIAICIATSWLLAIACGGATERQVPDVESAGAATAGSTSQPSRGGSASATAGASAMAGSITATGGSTLLPEPVRSCFNDTDCPNPQCGGEVCNWNKQHPNPSELDKPYTCNPAGSEPRSSDGWCTTDADCKCRAFGAKCVGVYCTFTRPGDAPGR